MLLDGVAEADVFTLGAADGTGVVDVSIDPDGGAVAVALSGARFAEMSYAGMALAPPAAGTAWRQVSYELTLPAPSSQSTMTLTVDGVPVVDHIVLPPGNTPPFSAHRHRCA